MGIFSKPDTPAPPPPPPAPAPVPTPVNKGVRERRQESRRRAEASRRAGGRESTIATGPQGLSSEAQTTKKTLLGQ